MLIVAGVGDTAVVQLQILSPLQNGSGAFWAAGRMEGVKPLRTLCDKQRIKFE